MSEMHNPTVGGLTMTRTATGTAALLFCCTTLTSAQTAAPLDLALLNATRRGECRAVADLLKKGANPNARDEEGATPLMRASLACQVPVLTQLLDRGADVNASDAQGRTALVYAIERDPPDSDFARRQLEVIKLLLARKANPAVKDEDGSTVLHYAARQRNVDVLKLMLTLGVPADGRNKDGATPLFVAAADGGPQTVEVLIAAGADINARDNSGRSVLAAARSRDNADVTRLLQARGARADAPATPSATPAPTPGNVLAPIEGISFEQWARANGRLTAEVPLDTVLASLKIDKARWERAHGQWTDRLAQHTATIGNEYARHFRAAMEEEAARRGEPGTTGGSPEPMPFEKWVEVQQASSAASERVPALYGMSRADWARVNSWWGQRLKTKAVDQTLYDQLSAKYEKQFAATPPAQSRPMLRDGALESNREPVPLETWVEMQQAETAAQVWTLKRHGLTTGQWIRASSYWGKQFNDAMLSLDSGTPAERAEKRRLYAEHQRLSEVYRKKYAQACRGDTPSRHGRGGRAAHEVARALERQQLFRVRQGAPARLTALAHRALLPIAHQEVSGPNLPAVDIERHVAEGSNDIGFDAGFFEDFAPRRLLGCLSDLNMALGKDPFEGRTAGTDQQERRPLVALSAHHRAGVGQALQALRVCFAWHRPTQRGSASGFASRGELWRRRRAQRSTPSRARRVSYAGRGRCGTE